MPNASILVIGGPEYEKLSLPGVDPIGTGLEEVYNSERHLLYVTGADADVLPSMHGALRRPYHYGFVVH